METNSNKNIATLLHLSALSQYVIPFGNFIFPIIIWSSSKDKSEYVDAQGKQTINFHLSLLVYSLIMVLIAVPLFLITIFSQAHYSIGHNDLVFNDFNISEVSGYLVTAIVIALLFCLLKVLVKTSDGQDFKYPITINFLK